jgi:hypothetical protein
MLFEAAFGTQISISPLSESITASPGIPHGVAAIEEDSALNATQKNDRKGLMTFLNLANGVC